MLRSCAQALTLSVVFVLSAATDVQVSGRNILVNNDIFHMKGVCWNPVPEGGEHPQNLSFADWVEIDSEIMQYAGVNLVRPYEPILNTTVLDILLEKGIYVANSAYSWGGSEVSFAVEVVKEVMHHPAIIMWTVGNEWNYNNLYSGLSSEEAQNRVKEVVDAVKATDNTRPVSTIYGELPNATVLEFLSNVDVWGINIYAGISFFDRFDKWTQLSDKPMYMGEYGADAWDGRYQRANYIAQAQATTRLTQEIVDHSTVNGGVCSGGMIFEFADEWWKAGNADVHDEGGGAPGVGPYPDFDFNEEWWGIVDIDRQPRPAYWAFRDVKKPSASTTQAANAKKAKFSRGSYGTRVFNM